MAAAHDAGLAHGALSPAQLLVRHDGLLQVSDYGLHRGVPRASAGSSAPPPRIAGATVGAPEYMAPEQLLGAPADTATDLYAAGVLLGECLAGARPFHSDSPLAFLAEKLDASCAIVAGSHGSSLRDVVARMAAPERERRPSSPHEILELLERIG
jgi:serine/threonine-protein kinase